MRKRAPRKRGVDHRGPAPPLLPTTLQRLSRMAMDDEALYTDAEVVGESFAQSTAKKVTFKRTVLRDLDLTGVRLEKLKLTDVRISNCDLANAVFREGVIDRVEFIRCRVTGLDLAELLATNLVFRECSGTLAPFRFASVKRARFEDCVLAEADFQNATLTDVVFRRCDLRGSLYYGAQVSGTDFRGSNLDDARIRAGDLAGAMIEPIQVVALSRSLAVIQGLVVRDLDDGVT
jgi:uncharacterized protein YjbI with pentapeptide repeats